jgi:hypothetical protein
MDNFYLEACKELVVDPSGDDPQKLYTEALQEVDRDFPGIALAISEAEDSILRRNVELRDRKENSKMRAAAYSALALGIGCYAPALLVAGAAGLSLVMLSEVAGGILSAFDN